MEPRRARFKVVMRPRQRVRRNRIAAALVLVLALGAVAFSTVRHLRHSVGNPWTYMKETYLPSLASVQLAADSPALLEAAEDFLADRPRASAAVQAAALREAFPCLKSVAIRRSWLRRAVRMELTPRAVVAAAKLKDGKPGYLSEDGAAFSAPAGLYAVTAPVVDAAAAPAAELRVAASLVRAAAQAGAVPAPVTAVRWSAADGWAARLEDGTELLWGDGRWAAEKLARLREVVADARSRREPAVPFVVDLRYFEDGKVLLRPLPGRSISMR